MSGTVGTVFLLVMMSYNSLNHTVTQTREMSWHLSHSECLYVMSAENTNGRRESHNHRYACIAVEDHEMRAMILNSPRNSYPRRYGSGNLTLRW